MKNFNGSNGTKRIMELIMGGINEKEDLMEEFTTDEITELVQSGVSNDFVLNESIGYKIKVDTESGTVILREYIGSEENVVVKPSYDIDGITYTTKLDNDSSGMFSDNSTLKTVEFSDGVDSSNVTNINEMFKNDTILTNVDMSTLDLSNVSSAESTFENTSALEQVLANDSYDTSNDINAYINSSISNTTILDQPNMIVYPNGTDRIIYAFNSMDKVRSGEETVQTIYPARYISGSTQYDYITTMTYFNGYYVMLWNPYSSSSPDKLMKSKDLKTWTEINICDLTLSTDRYATFKIIDGTLLIQTNVIIDGKYPIHYTKDLKTWKTFYMSDINPDLPDLSTIDNIFRTPNGVLWLTSNGTLFRSIDSIKFDPIYSDSIKLIGYCEFDDTIRIYSRSQLSTPNNGDWCNFETKIQASTGEIISENTKLYIDLQMMCKYKDGLAAFGRYTSNNNRNVNYYLYKLTSDTGFWQKVSTSESISVSTTDLYGKSLIFHEGKFYVGNFTITDEDGIILDKFNIGTTTIDKVAFKKFVGMSDIATD